MKRLSVLLVLLITLLLSACVVDDNGNDNENDNIPTITQREEMLVKAFVAFLDTKEGKSTIQANGGIVEVLSTDPSWNDIKVDHKVVTYNNTDVTIKFGGSTSVQSVAQALSNQFKSLAGNFVAEHNHTGSGDAFKRTQGSEKDGANAIHIGFASRGFNQAELDGAIVGTYGILSWDAVVAVVHPDNEVDNLTTEQLNQIYSQKDLNWTAFGGADGAVTAYTRDSSSGTREAFFDVIGLDKSHNEGGEDVGAETVDSNGVMMTSVLGNINGIGYISLSGLADSGLKGLSFNGIEATEENTINDTYELKRPFNYIVRG